MRSRQKRIVVMAATPLMFLGGLLPGEFLLATSEGSYVIMGLARLSNHVTGVVEFLLGVVVTAAVIRTGRSSSDVVGISSNMR